MKEKKLETKGQEESTLLELSKVKPIGEEESKRQGEKAMGGEGAEEEWTLLELVGKVKPIGEGEEESNKVIVVEFSKSKPEANIEEEERVNPLPNWRRKHPACLACCGVCCTLLIIILVVIIILAFTLFKVKDPRVHVVNMSLESFSISLPFNIPPTLSFNATLGLELSLKNPNWASVKYSNSTANVLYRGVEVGFFLIPPGHVGMRHTERIFSTIDLMADHLVGNSHIVGDFTSGSLPFSIRTRVSGKVKVLNVYKHHFDSLSKCSISIFTSNRSISNTICTYDVSI